MLTYVFHQLDVFTDTPLKGNPLAVFPGAEGLTAEKMQALAREMNLSETTFVTPSSTATRRVRFFTPTARDSAGWAPHDWNVVDAGSDR